MLWWGYNLQFDLEFLRAACTRNQKPILTNRKIDLLPLARRKVIGVANFKLLTLVRHFGLADRGGAQGPARLPPDTEALCKTE